MVVAAACIVVVSLGAQAEPVGNAVPGPPCSDVEVRISDMGAGNHDRDAHRPAVAWNATNDQYLVVWFGDDEVNEEFEIYGQLIDGPTGAEIGLDDFRISDMGTDGDWKTDARDVAVAWNATNNEYLVVWHGDDQIDRYYEIFGQRIDGASGAEVGANDFRISDMGSDGDGFTGQGPAVVWNEVNNEYLVVWRGNSAAGISPQEAGGVTWLIGAEVFGQRLDGATGVEVGADDFRISDAGFRRGHARDAAVTWNAANNEYLVVWAADNIAHPEEEIFGQRIDGATGDMVGADQFRISNMGPEGDTQYRVDSPSVAWNALTGEYLVVWHGDNNGLVSEYEIYGQRLVGATGAEVGADDFRISDMGPDGSYLFTAGPPVVTWHALENEYLVIWNGDDDTGSLVDHEFEIFGQRLDGTTAVEVGPNDFRITEMGANGSIFSGAFSSALTPNGLNNEYLLVWAGDPGPDDLEIYAQRICPPDPIADILVRVLDLLEVMTNGRGISRPDAAR